MNSVCFMFEVHQPHRLRWFWPDNKKGFSRYFDEKVNEEILQKVASKCYLPANRTLLEIIDSTDGAFKASMSVTGTLIEQCAQWNEEVIDLFRDLAKTGCIEFLDETCYHSLASLFESREEFMEEVWEHRKLMSDLIGFTPRIFRNTEMLYNNSIAHFTASMGYKAIMTEGIEHILNGRSPDHVYRAKYTDLAVLLRNYKLSDDIGYRFSSRWWEEYPLTAGKWADWAAGRNGQTLNIFMDYETFGEHQWKDTGIFEFLKALPWEVMDRGMQFFTPSQTVEAYSPAGEIDVGDFSTVSWADAERDSSAWLGNDMQRRCFEEMKILEPYVKQSSDPELLKIWKHLLTSDHYYYMSTKWLGDGDVHSYFSIHSSPYDAAVNFMAAVTDFKAQVFEALKKRE